MPIYEYTCTACNRRASLFFRSIGAVDSSPTCPHCGQISLQRRMSRVWSRSSSRDDGGDEPTFESDGVPFYGGDESMLGGGMGGWDDDSLGSDHIDGEGDGDEDIAAFAREARQMAAMMGEPLDADLDGALRHIEQGADPDDVFGELDAAPREPDAADPE